jgi:hypothetical protein
MITFSRKDAAALIALLEFFEHYYLYGKFPPAEPRYKDVYNAGQRAKALMCVIFDL